MKRELRVRSIAGCLVAAFGWLVVAAPAAAQDPPAGDSVLVDLEELDTVLSVALVVTLGSPGDPVD